MQVVTVFLGSFLVGSFFTNFRNWLDNPSSAATILGTAAPLQSIFFLNYIMFNVRLCACMTSDPAPACRGLLLIIRIKRRPAWVA